jgi:HK97 family phage portal protein
MRVREAHSGIARRSAAGGDAEPLIQRIPPTVNPELLRYEDAFEKNSWVYRAVVAKAFNIGEVPMKVIKRMKDGTTEDDNSDAGKALLELIQRPNSKMAGNDLVEAIVICKNIRQALLWMSWGKPEDGPRDTLTKAKKPPINLFLLPAHKTFAMTIDNRLMGWKVRDTGTFIPAAQVIQLAFYNPRDPYRGLPPASAAFQSADTDYALEIHNANFFENGMRLSGLISLEGSIGDEKRARIEAAVDSLTGVGNAHSLLTLDNGAKFTSMTAQQKDMDFKNLGAANRDKIAAPFGVPRLVFGDPIDANRTTAEISRKMFWLDTLLPEMRDIEDQLNANLVAPYYGEDLLLQFDRSQIEALSENRTEFATAFNQLMTGMDLAVKDKVISAQEARDVLRENFGLNIADEISIESLDPNPTADGQDDDDPEAPDGTPPTNAPNEEEPDEEQDVNDSPKKIVRIVRNAAMDRVRRGLPAISKERTQSLLQRRGTQGQATQVTVRLMDLVNEKLKTPEEVEKFFTKLEEKVAS